MRAVITVVGKDKPGILAYIAIKCAEREINIIDVTQKVLQDLFTMIMIVEVPSNLENFRKVANDLEVAGGKQHLKVHVMHEDIFNSMHTI